MKATSQMNSRLVEFLTKILLCSIRFIDKNSWPKRSRTFWGRFFVGNGFDKTYGKGELAESRIKQKKEIAEKANDFSLD